MENKLQIIHSDPLRHYRPKNSEIWRRAESLPAEMSGADKQKINTLIAGELAVLQVAFPTQARNFSQDEVEATSHLWQEIFGRIHPKLLHEAVKRFIFKDRKGFFPSPGLIVGEVEQIMEEIIGEERIEQNYEYLDEFLKQRKENGTWPE
ncbi:MAG: replicative helicase loader/inhibitor [Eubacteriales bacterium]